jgi:hypothetical protein
MVAGTVNEANNKVEEAEREVASISLQPLQAMLGSLKMVRRLIHPRKAHTIHVTRLTCPL